MINGDVSLAVPEQVRMAFLIERCHHMLKVKYDTGKQSKLEENMSMSRPLLLTLY